MSLMKIIFISLFLLIISVNNVSANCIASYNQNGIKIGVIGDFFLQLIQNLVILLKAFLKRNLIQTMYKMLQKVVLQFLVLITKLYVIRN